MILDHLNNAARSLPLHKDFAKAFEFLRQAGLKDMADGKYPIDGDRVVATIAASEGRGTAGAKIEAHRKFIDIQFTIAGEEVIGWKPTPACSPVITPYDPVKDIEFLGGEPITWVTVPPGTFMIFFPEDAHAPLAGKGKVRKVVVKVAV